MGWRRVDDGGLEPRTHGPLLPGLLVVAAVLAFVLLSSPGSTAYWAQELMRRATGEPSTAYAFMRTTTTTGAPVAWDHCRAITFVVNPAAAPPGWEDLVAGAVADVTVAGGPEWVSGGTTRDRDFLERRPGEPVLIGWGEPADFDELDGDVAGFGGATSLRVEGRLRYVTGEVLLDSGDYDLMARRGETDAMRQILVHELLHVVGLDHVEDRHQLMYPTFHGQDGLGPGDREGLRRLADQPCG